MEEVLVEDLDLLYEDKCILTTRAPVTARICNAAMQSIRSKTTNVAGMQPIDRIDAYLPDGRKFMQILPLCQKTSEVITWGTLSNVLSKEGHVTLYDAARRLRYVYQDKSVTYDV